MDESWLRADSRRRGLAPHERLLAIFDDIDQSSCPGSADDFLEPGPARQGVAAFIEEVATEAGFAEPERLAQIWLMLLHGTILAARAGDADAGRKARLAAEHVLVTWARSDPT
jgi:hypothetical protein